MERNTSKTENRIITRLRQARATMWVCARQVLLAGPLAILGSHFVKVIQLVVLVLLWRGYAAAGAGLGGLSLDQLLCYTLISFVLRQQLNILTPATSAMWEGSVIGRYPRPAPVSLSFASETVGRWWLPYGLFFGLPALLVAPLLGIRVLPASAGAFGLFLLSLGLSVIIGFAMDLILAAFAMRLKNAMWIAHQIREAIYNLFSGALIPFALFPAWARQLLGLLPFGSVASAPLSLYVGSGHAAPLLALQLFWAVVLWPLSRYIYKKSEERMVSFGG